MTQENNEDWAIPTLKEVPFWRKGMTPEEYDVGREYLGKNYHLFINMTYEPLWKQRMQELKEK